MTHLEKVELVKTIIVNLSKYLSEPEEIREWHNVPTADFMKKGEAARIVSVMKECKHNVQRLSGSSTSPETQATVFSTLLYTGRERKVNPFDNHGRLSLTRPNSDAEDDLFSSALVNDLLERFEENPIPHLTPNEQQSLFVLIQTTLQVGHNQFFLCSSSDGIVRSMKNDVLSTPTDYDTSP